MRTVCQIDKDGPHGTSTCEMFAGDDKPGRVYRSLETIIPQPCGDDDVRHVGLWFENGVLTDYDGVYQLRRFEIECIRLAEFTVPQEFEP